MHGDSDPLFGVLEDWDARGAWCCATRRTWSAYGASRRGRALGADDDPGTWSAVVRYVSVLLEELEEKD